jgi:hypothetical protein
MRFIKKQLSLWRIALIICAAAIAMPVAARERAVTKAQSYQQEDYWARRIERRIERREEYLDRQNGDDDEDADDEDSKDSKATADDEDDAGDTGNQEVERRRGHWRERLEREW